MATKSRVKFGLKNVHYALITFGEDGAITFGTPKPIPGAVAMSLAPQGETETFYADDVAYYVGTANDGYQGDLEFALIPDEFRIDVLGETLDDTDKVLVENSNAEAKPFVLLYEVSGDQKASKRLFYNCAAARPSEDNGTKTKSKTPATEKLSLTCSPLADGKVKAKTTEETPDSVLTNWFKTVWEPSAA